MEKIFLAVSLPLFKYCNYVLVTLHFILIVHGSTMSSLSLKFLIFIIFVTCCDCATLEENQKDKQLKHDIVKRGLAWPWLVYQLNAATGNQTC